MTQDLTGGMLVPVEGPDSPLFALEVCGEASLPACALFLSNHFFYLMQPMEQLVLQQSVC